MPGTTDFQQYLQARQLNDPVAPFESRISLLGNYFMDVLFLNTPPVGMDIALPAGVATPILVPPHQYAYLISNPSSAIGISSAITVINALVAPGLNAAGNTELTPTGVANYLNAHFFLNVTVAAGTWDFYLQAFDPVSTTWVDVQVLFGAITAPGTYYAYTGALGVGTDIAIRYDPTVAGAIQCTLSTVLKQGAGGASGMAGTVYIGNQNVNTTTGMPINEGEKQIVLPAEDVTVYAIAGIATTIRVFTL